MKPGGIVFDMYGTVADLSAVTKVCKDVVDDPVEFGSLWRSKQLEYTFLRSLMGDYVDFWEITESALQFAVQATEVDLTQRQKSLLMESWLRPEPYADAFDGLQKMKGRYPLAILSNGSPRMLSEGLRSAGLDTFFEWVLSVEEVQVFKPSPKVYELAPIRMGISKEKILFVSSNSFDVIGAKKYGFHTCWIRRTKSPLDQMGTEPDLVVGSFEELGVCAAEWKRPRARVLRGGGKEGGGSKCCSIDDDD